MKKIAIPTAILSADWHIREDSPVCRADNYMEAQKRKIEFILSLSEKYDCPILIAGDVGHRPIWGDRLLNWFINIIINNCNFIVTPGQHDLLNHRLDKYMEGGLGVLHKSLKNFTVITELYNYNSFTIYPSPYSVPIKNILRVIDKKRKIALCHQMVIKSQKNKLWEKQKAHSATWFLKKYSMYDLIITGDNHQSFAAEYGGRWLVNTGSLMRMAANQIDHLPSVYLWYAMTNEIKRVYLPIEQNVISREHLKEDNERDSRIESFVNRLNNSIEIGLSFEKNIEEFLKVNPQEKGVVKKIWEVMEKEG